jgi:hypothetical protein
MRRRGDEQSPQIGAAKTWHGGALNWRFNESDAMAVGRYFGQAVSFVHGGVIKTIGVHSRAIRAPCIAKCGV